MTDAMRGIVGAEHVRPASSHDAVRGVVPQIVVEPADLDLMVDQIEVVLTR